MARSKLNRRRRFVNMLKRVFRRHRPKTYKSAKVAPRIGCILKCDLGVLLEHTGIYIGKNRIVSLNRHGHIKIESPITFFPPGTNPLSNKIYTACFGNTDEVLGGKFVAERAKKKIDDHTKYNVLFNNCHRFSAGCITGNFDNEVMSFAQLEETILLHIEQLRAPLPFWQRVKNWFVKEKKTVKPSSFNWRAVKFD